MARPRSGEFSAPEVRTPARKPDHTSEPWTAAMFLLPSEGMEYGAGAEAIFPVSAGTANRAAHRADPALGRPPRSALARPPSLRCVGSVPSSVPQVVGSTVASTAGETGRPTRPCTGLCTPGCALTRGPVTTMSGASRRVKARREIIRCLKRYAAREVFGWSGRLACGGPVLESRRVDYAEALGVGISVASPKARAGCVGAGASRGPRRHQRCRARSGMVIRPQGWAPARDFPDVPARSRWCVERSFGTASAGAGAVAAP